MNNKSQEKNMNMRKKNENITTFISSNLKLLFDLDKEKNNLKKVDFCRKTGINKSTITKWIYKNIKPGPGNLLLLLQYFNRNLKTNISEDQILYEDLEKILVGWSFDTILKESMAQYLTIAEIKIIENYRKLPDEKKQIIENLLNYFE